MLSRASRVVGRLVAVPRVHRGPLRATRDEARRYVLGDLGPDESAARFADLVRRLAGVQPQPPPQLPAQPQQQQQADDAASPRR